MNGFQTLYSSRNRCMFKESRVSYPGDEDKLKDFSFSKKLES